MNSLRWALKKFWLVLFVPILVGAGCSADNVAGHADIDTTELGVSGTLRLTAVHSGKCLNVAGNSTASDAQVEQRTCSTSDWQKWQITDCGGGVHLLKNVGGTRLMRVFNASTADGASIVQNGVYDCSTAPNSRRFTFIDKGNGQFQLKNVLSGKCVDVEGAATGDGVRVQQWTCSEGNNQRFTLSSSSASRILENATDIGSTGATGSTSFSNGTYTVRGAGADIWGTVDAFQFAYTQRSGDFVITARVASITNTSGSSWTKAGVMIRESLAAGSKNGMEMFTGSNGTRWQYRNATDGGSFSENANSGTARWLRVRRTGTLLVGYRSDNGSSWTVTDAVHIPMTSTVFAGLAVTSHLSGTLNTATFDNVSIGGGPSSLTWSNANLTFYDSWPSAGSEECTGFNGCFWAGQFTYFGADSCTSDSQCASGQKCMTGPTGTEPLSCRFPAAWVNRHNIVSVYKRNAMPAHWDQYKGHILRLEQGTNKVDVWVLDTCGDSDCNGCCFDNADPTTGELRDIESATVNRFGTSSGTVRWACIDC